MRSVHRFAFGCLGPLLLLVGNADADHVRSHAAIHTVHKGETLDQIARAYGVKMEALVKVNHIVDPDLIVSGKRLFIPEANGASPPPARLRMAHASVPSKTITLRVDFIWPVIGPVTSWFGRRGRKNHRGIDIDASRGATIRAAGQGVVVHSGWGSKGYGRTVILEHPNGLRSLYAHNLRNLVQKGQTVRQGEPIALVGSTGWTTGSHLHFEIRNGKISRDPLNYLP